MKMIEWRACLINANQIEWTVGEQFFLNDYKGEARIIASQDRRINIVHVFQAESIRTTITYKLS
jgi:hypothetical protein